ncbi:putative non-specific serine/threonine protein kinase [Helianthus anomalus]
MYFSDNFISRPIPYCFANYTQLKLLNLGDNNFSGSIPQELGKRTPLSELFLFMNNLVGSIPPHINLTKMEMFSVSYYLPIKFRVSGLLKHFTVRDNHFSGHVPKSLKNCISLVRVRL